MKESFDVIGKRVPKIDAFDKVTGAAIYGHDMSLPGMLHGAILRSPYPHAKIVSIDTRAAKKLPGVEAVITAADVTVSLIGLMREHPVLKKDKVRSTRDEVAAVAAISEEIAREACSLIRVKYEELPAIFDPRDALKPGAPRIHDHSHDNRVGPIPRPGEPFTPFKYRFSAGDVDKALGVSAHVVEGEYTTHFVTHCCMEPCFCLAVFDARGRLTVYSSTQVPYLMQNHISAALGISGANIRVIQPVIGGAFGSKLDTHPYEIITILLAKATGKPVRILYDRKEEFQAAPTRQPMRIKMKTGCDKNGMLTARYFSALLDNGAYTSWGVTTPHIALIGISSLYRVPNVFFEAESVYTNNPYSGAFRGYGNPQGTFANEQQMDELAEKAGIDKVEFRLMNANKPNSETPQKFRITTCGMDECLKTAAERVEFTKEKAPYEGVGIAAMFHVGGGGRVYKSDGCGVIARLDDFGRLSLITGATEIGTGSDTAMAMIAAEELGIPVENVRVINNDTEIGPWDVGIHASRMTFIGGNAALRAAREIKEKLAPHAAAALKCPPENLVFRNGVICDCANPENSIAIDRLVRQLHFREHGQMMTGAAFYDPPNEFQTPEMLGNVSSTYSFAAHAVRVKVDSETGKIEILKFVAVHDVGRVLNPLGLEGQIEGAIAQGLGYALTEEVKLENGRVKNCGFLDYKLLTARDIPPTEIHFIETNDPEGPFGAKGVSEAGLIPTAAAVANAVRDAIGVRIKDLPLTPERVLAAIKSRM
jgi:xanthine dehydrogenase molybdenum-binding subunit